MNPRRTSRRGGSGKAGGKIEKKKGGGKIERGTRGRRGSKKQATGF